MKRFLIKWINDQMLITKNKKDNIQYTPVILWKKVG